MQHDNTIGFPATSVSKSVKHSIQPSPPLSRRNSFDSKSFARLGFTTQSSPTRDANAFASTQTQSNEERIMTFPATKSSLPPQPPDYRHNVACATTSTTHFDPLGTPKCKSNSIDDAVQALANRGTTPMRDFSVQMSQTVSDSLLPLFHDDRKCKSNHFDPMGTPRSNPKTVEEAMNAINATKNNGVFQLPDLNIGDVPVSAVIVHPPYQQQQQQQIEEEEDPFDEIVRHGRG